MISHKECLLLKKVEAKPGEMSTEHKDPAPTHIQTYKAGLNCTPTALALAEAETQGSLGLASCQPNARLNERLRLREIKWRATEQDTQCAPHPCSRARVHPPACVKHAHTSEAGDCDKSKFVCKSSHSFSLHSSVSRRPQTFLEISWQQRTHWRTRVCGVGGGEVIQLEIVVTGSN